MTVKKGNKIITIRNSSCGKVVFSQVSDCPWGREVYTLPGQIPPCADTLPGRRPLGRHPPPWQAETPPWADPLGGRHPPEQSLPLAGRHPPGKHPPADGYCSGWYTSYWNAFLLLLVLLGGLSLHLNHLYSIAHDNLQLAIWDTSFWTFLVKFGHKGP